MTDGRLYGGHPKLVEETISGFKKEGSWNDVVEYGEMISEVLDEEKVEGERVNEWNDWRPRVRESLEEDLPKKTAEKVSVDAEEKPGIKEKGKKVFGAVEKTVYKNIMSKTGPCYFDNELISANIKKKKGWLDDEESFSLEVDVYDSNLKQKVRSKI